MPDGLKKISQYIFKRRGQTLKLAEESFHFKKIKMKQVTSKKS